MLGTESRLATCTANAFPVVILLQPWSACMEGLAKVGLTRNTKPKKSSRHLKLLLALCSFEVKSCHLFCHWLSRSCFQEPSSLVGPHPQDLLKQTHCPKVPKSQQRLSLCGLMDSTGCLEFSIPGTCTFYSPVCIHVAMSWGPPGSVFCSWSSQLSHGVNVNSPLGSGISGRTQPGQYPPSSQGQEGKI